MVLPGHGHKRPPELQVQEVRPCCVTPASPSWLWSFPVSVHKDPAPPPKLHRRQRQGLGVSLQARVQIPALAPDLGCALPHLSAVRFGGPGSARPGWTPWLELLLSLGLQLAPPWARPGHAPSQAFPTYLAVRSMGCGRLAPVANSGLCWLPEEMAQHRGPQPPLPGVTELPGCRGNWAPG